MCRLGKKSKPMKQSKFRDFEDDNHHFFFSRNDAAAVRHDQNLVVVMRMKFVADPLVKTMKKSDSFYVRSGRVS